MCICRKASELNHLPILNNSRRALLPLDGRRGIPIGINEHTERAAILQGWEKCDTGGDLPNEGANLGDDLLLALVLLGVALLRRGDVDVEGPALDDLARRDVCEDDEDAAQAAAGQPALHLGQRSAQVALHRRVRRVDTSIVSPYFETREKLSGA